MTNSTTPTQLERLGAWGAFFEAFAYLIGFVVMLFFLTPDEGEELLPFLLKHKTLYQWWMLIIYVVFGIVLVPLVLALRQRLDKKPSISLKLGTIFGQVWVVLVIASGMIAHQGIDSVARVFPIDSRQAAIMWATFEGVQNGLGGGVEIVGGLWVLFVSIVALRNQQLGKKTNYLGLIVGEAGILTVVPGLSELGAVFGLLQIVWFIAIGKALLQPSN